jgi:CubicO group peptidase (beta-lactamase class C family)
LTHPTPPIEGHCDPRFAAVRDAFAESFARGEEVGASLSVVEDGRCVVDLYAGHADQARTRPWTRDTLVNVYSTTKAMAALCLLQLVEQGKVDLDAPVARYWPEFAAAGKDELPIRWLLGHRAGLAAVRKLLPGEALYDWDTMAAALAAETPWWTPGERHGYHAVTFGWLVGEVVRRVTGRSVGTYFREQIAGPLDADFHIGLPDAQHERVAEMSAMAPPEPGSVPNLLQAFLDEPEGLLARAFMNPPSMAMGPNHAAWRRAEIPGANGQANARGIARVYGALARGGTQDGVDVLQRETLARAREEQSAGPDAVLQLATRFGLGFMLPQAARDTRFGPSESAFGHPGAGGSIGFADPEAKLGFGYAMNKMGPSILVDARPLALIDAVYASLG